jgi:hypothetical protein
MWDPRRLTTLWVSTAIYRDSFTVYTFILCVFCICNLLSSKTLNSLFTLNRILHKPCILPFCVGGELSSVCEPLLNTEAVSFCLFLFLSHLVSKFPVSFTPNNSSSPFSMMFLITWVVLFCSKNVVPLSLHRSVVTVPDLLVLFSCWICKMYTKPICLIFPRFLTLIFIGITGFLYSVLCPTV